MLAEQQHKYLSRYLPQFSTRLITGSDNIHLWSTQEIWNAVLLNVNIVISTPQILLEGLDHGFVQLQRISLLVIDEAHHCTAKAPSNTMMQRFYHPLRHSNSAPELPHILGLTASPITTKLKSIKVLEANLNAVCRTPTRQLAEYHSHTYMPEFVTLNFEKQELEKSLSIEMMLNILDTVDFREDPWLMHLSTRNTLESLEKYEKALCTKSTYSMDQLKKMRGNTEHLHSQLGVWATNFWLQEVLLKLHSSMEGIDWLATLKEEERRFLNDALREVRETCCKAIEEGDLLDQVSSKVECLIDFLVKEYTESVSCVIFVERRSTAFALASLLQNHPSIPYAVASFVGGSTTSKRNDMIDLADLATQKNELEEFRAGLRSIVIATSVMEEGIDVQATNLVIRFDDCKTVRSYVQSRGRARKFASKFVVMRCRDDPISNYINWAILEAEMKLQYSNEMRQIQAYLQLEAEDKEGGQEVFTTSTGAKLTFENARAHLEHFCQSLAKVHFEPNPRPTFFCIGTHGEDVSAKVILPSSLPGELREVWGTGMWRTEKLAKRDAAFEATKRLHSSGLINDHLLPPSMPRLDVFTAETRATFADIRPRINPWRPLNTGTVGHRVVWYVHRVLFEDAPISLSSLLLLLPNKLESGISVPLHYTKFQSLQARVMYIEARTTNVTSQALAREVTLYLMGIALVSRSKNPDSWEDGLPFYLLPDVPEADLRSWLNRSKHSLQLTSYLTSSNSSPEETIALRYASNPGLYLSDLEGTEPAYTKSLSGLLERTPAILAKRLPKRIDYLNKNNAPSSMVRQSTALAINDCVVEQIPTSTARTMQFIPSIIYTVESALVSAACCTDLLQTFHISNQQLIVEALTSPLVSSHVNYERLEFFGDTLLKFYACLQVFAKQGNAHLPEGYLTVEVISLVNNARLQRAAVGMGLDHWLIHEPFVPKKWKPQTYTTQEDEMRPSRTTSTKVVADHVEALIAVAYLDDGSSPGADTGAVALINGLLPEIEWSVPASNIAALRHPGSPNFPSFEALSVAEKIIGYTFERRHLLAEALNHSSVSTDVPTYGRLEFLGDAVLQRIVNEAVYKAAPRYPQDQMHLRQIVCVSHSYLAFLCFEAHHDIQRINVRSDAVAGKVALEEAAETKYLWEFMAHSNIEIATAQRQSLIRYRELQGKICEQLAYSKTYPWTLLASIAAPKFFSDIIESVLAAVYIDSGADLATCTKFLERLGLICLLRRLVDEPDMILEQPKTILWQERAKAGLPALKAVFRSRREVDGQRYKCQLLLEGEVYAEVDDAWCEEEAVLRACEIGLVKFRREQEASKIPGVEAEASQLTLGDESEQRKRKRRDSSQSASSSAVSDDE